MPTASDRDGDKLRFYIRNRPAWATFSDSMGKLSGTPSTLQVGTYTNIRILVSDGSVGTSLPALSVSVATTATSTNTSETMNRDPVISESPPTSVEAGRTYSFQPFAADVDGGMLSFWISGKPVWATLSVSKGLLTGTPTAAQVGSYSNIVISVNDGTVSKSLASFGITVTAPATSPSGNATLIWAPPKQNTDGSLLTNLGGYRVHHGTCAGALTDLRMVAANSSSFQFNSLPAGVHYFAISAYTTEGIESALSSVASMAIP